MGIFDSIGNVASDIIGSFKPGGSMNWLQTPATLAVGLYGINQQRGAQNSYLNYLREQERIRAERENAMYEAYAGHNEEIEEAEEEGAGMLEAALAEANAMLRPFYNAGMEVLPQQTDAYKKFLETLTMLNAYYTTPQMLEQMNYKPLPQNINVTTPPVNKKAVKNG